MSFFCTLNIDNFSKIVPATYGEFDQKKLIPWPKQWEKMKIHNTFLKMKLVCTTVHFCKSVAILPSTPVLPRFSEHSQISAPTPPRLYPGRTPVFRYCCGRMNENTISNHFVFLYHQQMFENHLSLRVRSAARKQHSSWLSLWLQSKLNFSEIRFKSHIG